MRIIRYSIYFFIFVVSLIVSRYISSYIFHPKIQISPITAGIQSKETLAAPLSTQVNLLILNASSFTDPVLQSAWWIAISPHSPLTIVNLYPTSELDNGIPQRIKQEFGLRNISNNQYDLSFQFLKFIRGENIPWDGYIVLDNEGLAIVINYLGGIDLNGEKIDGIGFLSHFVPSNAIETSELEFHIDIWESICKKSFFAGSPESFELVRPDLTRHVILSSQFPITFSAYQDVIANANHTNCDVLPLQNDQTFVLPYENPNNESVK